MVNIEQLDFFENQPEEPEDLSEMLTDIATSLGIIAKSTGIQGKTTARALIRSLNNIKDLALNEKDRIEGYLKSRY